MKNITLSNKEHDLLLHFLEDYSNELGNRGCNDLSQELIDKFTPCEGAEIAREFAKMNNPKEPDGPDWPITDDCLVSWLTGKIKENTNEI